MLENPTVSSNNEAAGVGVDNTEGGAPTEVIRIANLNPTPHLNNQQQQQQLTTIDAGAAALITGKSGLFYTFLNPPLPNHQLLSWSVTINMFGPCPDVQMCDVY